MVPHLGIARERDRELVVVDYIPRRRKSRLVGRGDSFALFDGLYRVRRYRLEAIGSGDSLREAVISCAPRI